MFTAQDTDRLSQLIDIPSADIRMAIHDITNREAYESFFIPKANGTKRAITAPKPLLKRIQRAIIPIIEPLPLPNAVHGFRKGRSIVTAARLHLNAHAMISIDLKHFFHTVTDARVHSALTKSLIPRLVDETDDMDSAEATAIVGLLAHLCTYSLKAAENSPRVLPQGAPCSPHLANLTARPLDIAVRRFLESIPGEYVYTRYADDLTITAPHEIDRNVLGALLQVIHRTGFTVNRDKVSIASTLKGSAHFRQKLTVTGLILDRREGRVRIPRARLDRLRLELHQAAHVEELQDDVLQSIEGMISFVHMVYGRLPASIDRAYERFATTHKRARIQPGKSRKRARQKALNPLLYT
jgi:hypothetical protein